MRFNVQFTCNTARCGIIDGGEKLSKFNMKTPGLLQYTKGGSIPHIIPDVFQKITKESVPLYLPVPNIITFHERMKKYPGSINDFIGMKDHVTYVSVVDSGEERRKGYHEKNGVPIWSRYGRMTVDVETYMDFVEALKPDMFLTLCDCDTDLNSSKKRVSKSLDRSLEFFSKCMDLYNKSEILKQSKVVGALVGGYDVEAREICSSAVGKASIFGIVIDGLHDCSKKVSSIPFKQIKPMVEASLKFIPSEQLRICHGCWHPKVVLDLITLGVDLFDTSYPYLIAEDGGALTFVNDNRIFENYAFDPPNDSSGTNGSNEIVSDGECQTDLQEPIIKKVKVSSATTPMFISLHDKKYAESLEPISDCCTCLTCKNHTKAYIHHLLHVKELLGPILLMIHNLHHYFCFFETIQGALKNGKFEIMKDAFEKMVNS